MSKKMEFEKIEALVACHIIYNVSDDFMEALLENEDELSAEYLEQLDEIKQKLEQEAIAHSDAEGYEYTEGEIDEISVLGWWTVSQDFAEAAALSNEVILKTPFGYVWGRQTVSQAVASDFAVREVFRKMDLI